MFSLLFTTIVGLNEPNVDEIEEVVIHTNEYCIDVQDMQFDDCFDIMMPKFMQQLLINKGEFSSIKHD